MAELDSNLIKELGNWNPSTMEAVYSTKIPLEALRGMGGYSKDRGLFWCPRAGIIPPKELQEMIFPGIDEVIYNVKLDLGRKVSEYESSVFIICTQN
jgi:hypothetical protein